MVIALKTKIIEGSKDLVVEVVLALGVSGLLTASKRLLVSNVCHAVDP